MAPIAAQLYSTHSTCNRCQPNTPIVIQQVEKYRRKYKQLHLNSYEPGCCITRVMNLS